MVNIVIGLGSNIEPRFQNLNKAQEALTEVFGDNIGLSSIYSSVSWGVNNQKDYLNQIAVFKTDSSAKTCLEILKKTEIELGRKTRERWTEREIDLDILFYGDEIIEVAGLCIPHNSLHLRNFVLIPLVEIMPDFIHPKFNKTIKTLLAETKDPLEVTIWKRK